MKITTIQFIEKASKIHEGKYDYSHSIYLNAKQKLTILCLTHGEFSQTPSNHLHNKQGCPKCGNENISKALIENAGEFIDRLAKIHNNLYDYSKVNYKGRQVKIEIICKKHGSFYQRANNHFRGTGCPHCGLNISKLETEFLDYIGIPNTREARQVCVVGRKVDGIDRNTNTIYEFLGDYWHGNPKKFNQLDFNKLNKITFGKLLENTLKKFSVLKTNGYNVNYIWENDWKIWNKTGVGNIPIISYSAEIQSYSPYPL